VVEAAVAFERRVRARESPLPTSFKRWEDELIINKRINLIKVLRFYEKFGALLKVPLIKFWGILQNASN
jgi:hypothetical protein